MDEMDVGLYDSMVSTARDLYHMGRQKVSVVHRIRKGYNVSWEAARKGEEKGRQQYLNELAEEGWVEIVKEELGDNPVLADRARVQKELEADDFPIAIAKELIELAVA